MKPTVFRIFISSWAFALRHHPAIALSWLVSLALGMPAVLLLQSLLTGAFGNTHVPLQWLDEFEMVYVTDWLMGQPGLISSILLQVVALAVLHWLTTVFVSGGIMAAAVNEEPVFSARSFFGAAAIHFFRFLRLSLFVLTGCVLALVWLMLGRLGMVFWALTAAFLMIGGDVAKAKIVDGRTTRVWMEYLSAIKWAFGKGVRVGSFYGLSGAVLIAGFLVYSVANKAMNPDSAGWIILMVILQQSFAVLRSAVRVQIFGGAAALWMSGRIAAGDGP